MSCFSFANIVKDCTDPVTNGQGPDIWIMLHEDYQNSVITTDVTDGFVTGITPPSGKYLYKIQGAEGSVGVSIDVRRGAFRTTFGHTVIQRVFDNQQDLKNVLDGIYQERWVAIVKNNHAGTDSTGKFEIYGTNSGLRAIAETIRATDNADLGGGYQMTLQSDDNSDESELPVSFLDTDIPTTLAAIEALESPTDV